MDNYMNQLTTSVENYGKAIKKSSLLNLVYDLGDGILTNQPAGILGCYLVSAIKISQNFNPLAAGAAFATKSLMEETLLKISLKLNIPSHFSIFVGSLATVGMAGIYFCVSALTIKEQLAVNAILFIAGIFAKTFGKHSAEKEQTRNEFANLSNKNHLGMSMNTLGGQLQGLVSSCILSATKIFKNFSPLAAAGSHAIYDFALTASTFYIHPKNSTLSYINDIVFTALSILAAASFYICVSTLTFKTQLLVNVILLVGSIAGAAISFKSMN